MLPREFRQEKLHRAHVKAVAAMAGVDFNTPETDCGVDGTFRTFAKYGDRVLGRQGSGSWGGTRLSAQGLDGLESDQRQRNDRL